MQTLEQPNQGAADLYWLAFLLTGHREASVDLAVAAFDFQEDANPGFSNWMVAWSRKVVIAKALAAIRDDLAASARRIPSWCADKSALPPRTWAPDRTATKVQIERALLAIDVFPRCAVLLSVFEGVSLEDAAVLLDADRDLLGKARTIGLRDLTRNLARMQGWTPTATRSYVVTGEMQHA